MDTTNSEKLPIRFIDFQGTIYLRKEDVVHYLYELAYMLETDSRNAVLQAANLFHTAEGGSKTTLFVR